MGYRNLKSLSVLISLVLRHKPEAAGISLDEHGWADIETLMAGMRLGRTQAWMWPRWTRTGWTF